MQVVLTRLPERGIHLAFPFSCRWDLDADRRCLLIQAHANSMGSMQVPLIIDMKRGTHQEVAGMRPNELCIGFSTRNYVVMVSRDDAVTHFREIEPTRGQEMAFWNLTAVPGCINDVHVRQGHVFAGSIVCVFRDGRWMGFKTPRPVPPVTLVNHDVKSDPETTDDAKVETVIGGKAVKTWSHGTLTLTVSALTGSVMIVARDGFRNVRKAWIRAVVMQITS